MGTNLKFVKIHSLDQVPRYLFDQIRDRDFDIDRLYKWAPVFLKNPVNLFGAFIDKSESVKGIMWTSFNPITNKLMVHILSIDREYQGKGILKEVDGILKKLMKNVDAEAVTGSTIRPMGFERTMGFKKSKTVIMEKCYGWSG